LRPLKAKFHVNGLGLSDGDENGPIEVSVAWVRKDEDTISWSYLLDASEAMASHRWRSVILPAYAGIRNKSFATSSGRTEKTCFKEDPRRILRVKGRLVRRQH